ncbi:MAG: hypothetical protein FWC27_04320, partial [Firmicutes bacterium]|nr:hypothetical protein [Bacillota bacterium]
MSGLRLTYIPILVLGECRAPDAQAFAERFGIPCGVTRVPETRHLQKALDAALAQSDTLLLLGGFQGEDLLPLALLTETLSEFLMTEERRLSIRLFGQEDEAAGGALLYTQDIRIYVCCACETRREAVLEEIQKEINPEPAHAPANAWLPLSKPGWISSKAPPEKMPEKRLAPRGPAKPPLAASPLLAVLAAALLAFCVGIGYLIYYAADSGMQDGRDRAVQALHPADKTQDGDRAGDGTLRQFEALRSLNSDCAGWLSIPGAGVDQPVMLES